MMSDEELRQEEIRNARFLQEEQKDLLREYVELRLLLNDPFATMKAYVHERWREFLRRRSGRRDPSKYRRAAFLRTLR
jgi:hypothetical protein